MNNFINSLRSQAVSTFDTETFLLAVLASLAAALAASAMYRRFYEHRGTGSQIHRAFPLLAISITTLFVAVQLSLPLSLGLLGALSIIRFRTPIKEPEEVGFVMLVIASSITCATLNFQYLALLNATALLTLVGRNLLRRPGSRPEDGILMLSLEDPLAEGRLRELTDFVVSNTRSCTLDSSSRKGGVTSVHFTFGGLKCDVETFQRGLERLGTYVSVNIHFGRPGGLA